ncbi:MAG: hypothetical protein E7262_01545 [Lachnospiraceae bacterium]|nr:hypothetical protein [Lachnospiraceae bacterium]
MKRKVFVLTLLLMIIVCSFCAYAAKDQKEFGVHARTMYSVEDAVVGTVDTKTGEHVVNLDDGKLQIRVSGIIDEAARLMVMPIKKDKKEVWSWLQSITKEIGENKSAYDIFFVDDRGERIEVGEGSQVSVISNVRQQKVAVYYITDAGEHNALKSIIEEYVVKFNMIRNGYYTLLVQNGKEEIGTDFEKGDDKIDTTTKPVDEEKEDEKDDEESAESDMEDMESGTEGDSSGAASGNTKEDNIWLIIMIGVIGLTAVLFIIVFIGKKKKENNNNYDEPNKKNKKSKKNDEPVMDEPKGYVPKSSMGSVNETPKPVDKNFVEEVSVKGHYTGEDGQNN